MGNRNEATIREMEAMGFERTQIDEALRAAFFNPDRAIEYLLNGIPENIRAEQRQPTPAAGAQGTPASPPAAQPAQPAQTGGDEPVNLFEAAAQANQGRGGAARSGGGAAAAGGQGNPQMDLAYLRQSPHFQQLRQIVQQQPSMLEPILQQVAEGNPQLAQMISLNPDQFLQLLAEVCSLFHSAGIHQVANYEYRAKKVTMVHFHRVGKLSALRQRNAMLSSDSSDLDLVEIKSFRHTLRATRMRNWRRIFFSSNPRMTSNNERLACGTRQNIIWSEELMSC
jgi:UV excision repair protein Rad23